MDKLYIKRAIVSVYNKEGLKPILNLLNELKIELISSSGTSEFIKSTGMPVTQVEDLTSYPSILDGRVKTLHPKIFGPILACKNNKKHTQDLSNINAQPIDLVIVDLYPFEETLRQNKDHVDIIEKIDIGGQSLIRAAAKNYENVIIVACKQQYTDLEQLLLTKRGYSTTNDRLKFATKAFETVKEYDITISNYFNKINSNNMHHDDITVETSAYLSEHFHSNHLRYGENPNQEAVFYTNKKDLIKQISGKSLSYNNLLDIDSALNLMNEFEDEKDAVFAIIKHTNVCGIAVDKNITEAFNKALQGDPISAFGGIFITNKEVDIKTANQLYNLFFEVLLAPSFHQEAINLFQTKKKRILITYKKPLHLNKYNVKNLLNGIAIQTNNNNQPTITNMVPVTNKKPYKNSYDDLLFALKIAKHLKSNAIAITKDKMLIGMGTGQTSRIDALKHAIQKASSFGFDLNAASLASDGFFPFADSIEIAKEHGITNIVQPGGSIRDQEVIDACNKNNIAMMFTNTRYFKH